MAGGGCALAEVRLIEGGRHCHTRILPPLGAHHVLQVMAERPPPLGRHSPPLRRVASAWPCRQARWPTQGQLGWGQSRSWRWHGPSCQECLSFAMPTSVCRDKTQVLPIRLAHHGTRCSMVHRGEKRMPRPPFPPLPGLVPAAPWPGVAPAASPRPPMAAFQTLLGLAGHHTPTTYKMLYAGEPTG